MHMRLVLSPPLVLSYPLHTSLRTPLCSHAPLVTSRPLVFLSPSILLLRALVILVQVNAASCVVGMLDYSTASLCLAHSTPYIYIKPGLSSDEPFICSLLHRHGLGVEMPMHTYHAGNWDSYLDQALALAASHYRCGHASCVLCHSCGPSVHMIRVSMQKIVLGQHVPSAFPV